MGPVVSPVEAWVDHHGFRYAPLVVPPIHPQVLLLGLQGISEYGYIPIHLTGQRPGVRVDQQLVWVVAVALQRVEGAVNPVAVHLAGAGARQIAVPHMGGDLREPDYIGFPVGPGIVEAQLHARGILSKEGEVHSLPVPGGSKGIGPAWPDTQIILLPVRALD